MLKICNTTLQTFFHQTLLHQTTYTALPSALVSVLSKKWQCSQTTWIQQTSPDIFPDFFICFSHFQNTNILKPWLFLSSSFPLSLSVSLTHTHTDTCARTHTKLTSQQTNTLTSNLGADRTTHTVSHTKCLECHKHLFRLKRRFFFFHVCVCVCVYVCTCVHISVFAEREGKFNYTCRPPDRKRSNMTKYFGCVVHKTGQVYT